MSSVEPSLRMSTGCSTDDATCVPKDNFCHCGCIAFTANIEIKSNLFMVSGESNCGEFCFIVTQANYKLWASRCKYRIPRKYKNTVTDDALVELITPRHTPQDDSCPSCVRLSSSRKAQLSTPFHPSPSSLRVQRD